MTLGALHGMFPFVLPLLFTSLAWLLGRPIIAASQARRPSEGEAVFVGLAVVLVVLSFFGFVARIGTHEALWVIAPLALVVGVAGRRHLRGVDRSSVALLACVFLVTYLHFLWPLVTHRHADIALVYAGDYNEYIGVGTWLQENSIFDPAGLDLGFNPLHSSVLHHQAIKLRIGALLLLSFFSAISAPDVPHAYAAFTGFVLAIEALAVALLARRIAPRLPRWVAALAGLLFGLCPTASYAAYSSFLPQAIGLAFIVAAVASLVRLLEMQVDEPVRWPAALARCIPCGLLFFASWSCYPEAVPLAVLVSLCYLLFWGRRLLQAPMRRGVAQCLVGVLGVWILASPPNFRWGIEGILLQLQGTPHGGEQHVTPWTVFGMMTGTIDQPLFPEVGTFAGHWFQYLSLAACVAMLAGLVFLLVRERARLAAAVVVSAVILVAFVLQHYSFARLGSLPDWAALFTWNLFKAASFLNPFMLAAGVVGVIAMGDRLLPRRGLQVAAGLVAASLLALAAHHDRQTVSRTDFVSVPKELREFLVGIPPGRLLLDILPSDATPEYDQRFGIYGALRYRPFLSLRDGQPPALHMPREASVRQTRARLFSEPFRYVLTDHPERYPGAREAGRCASYHLLDVQKIDFLLTAMERGRQPETLVNLAATGTARSARLQIFNAQDSKVFYERSGAFEELALGGQDGAVVTLPVSARGGLTQLTFDPVPAATPEIVLYTGEGASERPVRIDLSAQIADDVSSTDTEGQRMSVQREPGKVVLSMPRLGTSRARLATTVTPGDYLLHIETGQVAIAEQAPGGFGAYVGPDNDRARSVELSSNAKMYLHISVPNSDPMYFALGFGGWGKARGTAEIKVIELVRPGAKR